MKYLSCLALVAVFTWSAVEAGDQAKGTVVELEKLKSLTPTEWKKEKPANNLRIYQFKLPRAKDDGDDAELTILSDAPRPAESALERWKELFVAPEGHKIDEFSKVSKFEVGAVKATYLDVTGIYLQLPRPLAPKKDAKLRPGFRMLAVFFDTPDGAFTIRLIGPEATIQQHKTAFERWLKNFK